MNYNEIYENAFNDELEKVALLTPNTYIKGVLAKATRTKGMIRKGQIHDFKHLVNHGIERAGVTSKVNGDRYMNRLYGNLDRPSAKIGVESAYKKWNHANNNIEKRQRLSSVADRILKY